MGPALTDALVEAMSSGKFDFIVANFANPDMVGHTGDWPATIAALEFIDVCLRRDRRRAARSWAAMHYRRPWQRR